MSHKKSRHDTGNHHLFLESSFFFFSELFTSYMRVFLTAFATPLAFAVLYAFGGSLSMDWCASKSTELFTLFCEFGVTRTELESAVHIVFEFGKQEPLPKELFALFRTRVSESDALTASTSVRCNTHNTRTLLSTRCPLLQTRDTPVCQDSRAMESACGPEWPARGAPSLIHFSQRR